MNSPLFGCNDTPTNPNCGNGGTNSPSFRTADGTPVTFGCNDTPANPDCGVAAFPCHSVCDNSGRDIERTTLAEIIAEIAPETAYKEGDALVVADNSAIALKLIQTLTDFTKRSGFLRRKETYTAQAGVRDYYLTPPEGESIHLITSICVNGQCIEPARIDSCCRDRHPYRCECAGGRFVFEPPDKVVLDKALCSNCAKVEFHYITYVKHDACKVDRLLLDRYRETIMQGTVSRLRLMAGFGWSQPQLGLLLARQFEAGSTRAAIDDADGYAGGRQSFDAGGW